MRIPYELDNNIWIKGHMGQGQVCQGQSNDVGRLAKINV